MSQQPSLFPDLAPPTTPIIDIAERVQEALNLMRFCASELDDLCEEEAVTVRGLNRGFQATIRALRSHASMLEQSIPSLFHKLPSRPARD